MAKIGHICDGHEYLYDTITGDVTNNYGQHVSSLRICILSRMCLLYKRTEHWPKIYACDAPLAFAPSALLDTDAAKARFAIGHTAVNLPEPR